MAAITVRISDRRTENLNVISDSATNAVVSLLKIPR